MVGNGRSKQTTAGSCGTPPALDFIPSVLLEEVIQHGGATLDQQAGEVEFDIKPLQQGIQPFLDLPLAAVLRCGAFGRPNDVNQIVVSLNQCVLYVDEAIRIEQHNARGRRLNAAHVEFRRVHQCGIRANDDALFQRTPRVCQGRAVSAVIGNPPAPGWRSCSGLPSI